MAHHSVPDDGEPQAAAAAFSGTGLVHPVKAVKNMGQVFFGDADARVLHLQHRLVFPGKEPQADAAAPDVILDAVFGQVENDLVDAVRVAQDAHVRRKLAPEIHLLLPGQGREELQRFLHHGPELHRLADRRGLPVHSGKLQELFRGAVQAVCLHADVRDKFPHGLRVHGLTLDHTVRQEADGGQRRL